MIDLLMKIQLSLGISILIIIEEVSYTIMYVEYTNVLMAVGDKVFTIYQSWIKIPE